VLRDDVKPDTVILAVAKAIEAKFNRGMWLELALLTGTRDEVLAHRRLLRSLD
jgi:AbiJ-like protein